MTAAPVVVSPETFLAMGREVLASQPFSVLLGAELHVPITDQLRQQHGLVHGGAVSYAADNALTYAGGSALRVPSRHVGVQDQLRAACPG